MRLRRAVLQIPAKSSVPPRLPFYKNHLLPTRSQSTLPQPLISLHFNSFRTNVYKKPGGSGPAANPKVHQLVTFDTPRLRTRRNPRNPLALMELLHNSRTPRGWGRHPLFSSFSVPSVASALKSPFHPAKTSSHSRKPIPATSSLSLFTTHHPLLTLSPSFQGKIYPTKSRSHHV
jgi:hypothetical protein